LEKCDLLSKQFGVPIFLKLEFLQITGSFKVRGALYRMSRLNEQECSAGVVTCSAGNHGWAMAYAAHLFGIPVTVYVPAEADTVKVEGIASQGARVIRSEFPGYDETEKFAKAQAKSLGLAFVSPYDDFAVMAANGGTIAREILEEAPEVATFVVPVGGGGLAAGLGYCVKSRRPDSHLVACQHTESPALKLSLERGEAVTELPPIRTAAGGIEGGIGTLTFPILEEVVDEIVLLSEAEIVGAVRWFLAQHRYLIEPSSAVTLAACLTGKLAKIESPAVMVLTGRNVALDHLKAIMGDRSDQ
jgi:threonine dehydratase